MQLKTFEECIAEESFFKNITKTQIKALSSILKGGQSIKEFFAEGRRFRDEEKKRKEKASRESSADMLSIKNSLLHSIHCKEMTSIILKIKNNPKYKLITQESDLKTTVHLIDYKDQSTLTVVLAGFVYTDIFEKVHDMYPDEGSEYEDECDRIYELVDDLQDKLDSSLRSYMKRNHLPGYIDFSNSWDYTGVDWCDIPISFVRQDTPSQESSFVEIVSSY